MALVRIRAVPTGGRAASHEISEIARPIMPILYFRAVIAENENCASTAADEYAAYRRARRAFPSEAPPDVMR